MKSKKLLYLSKNFAYILYSKFIKNTLFAITSTLLIFSAKTIAISDSIINLRLNEKPENISVYQWCKDISNENVMQKRVTLLKELGKIPKNCPDYQLEEHLNNWEAIKINFEQEHAQAVTNGERSFRKFFISERLRELIKNFLTNAQLRQELKIARVEEKDNIIIAHRTGDEKEIKFLGEDEQNKLRCPAASDSYNVLLSENSITEWGTSNETLEAFIGHELGHVKNKHLVENYSIQRLIDSINAEEIKNGRNLKANEENSRQKRVQDAYDAFVRSQELQADITGSFNNLVWLGQLQEYFSRQANGQNNPFSLGQDLDHPSIGCRADYLAQFYNGMQREAFGPRINENNRNNNDARRDLERNRRPNGENTRENTNTRVTPARTTPENNTRTTNNRQLRRSLPVNNTGNANNDTKNFFGIKLEPKNIIIIAAAGLFLSSYILHRIENMKIIKFFRKRTKIRKSHI